MIFPVLDNIVLRVCVLHRFGTLLQPRRSKMCLNTLTTQARRAVLCILQYSKGRCYSPDDRADLPELGYSPDGPVTKLIKPKGRCYSPDF